MNNIPFFSDSQTSRLDYHETLEMIEKPLLSYRNVFPIIKTFLKDCTSYSNLGENVLLVAVDKISGEIFMGLKETESPMRNITLYTWSHHTNEWREETTGKNEAISPGYERCLHYTNLSLFNYLAEYHAKIGLNEYDDVTHVYNQNYFKLDFIDGRTKVFSFSTEAPFHSKGCFLIPAIDVRAALFPRNKNARNCL